MFATFLAVIAASRSFFPFYELHMTGPVPLHITAVQYLILLEACPFYLLMWHFVEPVRNIGGFVEEHGEHFSC